MKTRNRLYKIFFTLLCTSFILTDVNAQDYNVETVFLTWQQDPTTTITIDWHTSDKDYLPVIFYKKRGDKSWQERNGETHGFPFTDRDIHRVELSNLEPGMIYEFKFENTPEPYWFKTMPSTSEEPITFLAGGDVGISIKSYEMTKTASTLNPDFIVLGGDLAYGNGEPVRAKQWIAFLDGLQQTFGEESNRVVPFIMAIGNHETWGEHNMPDSLEIDHYRKKYKLYNGDAPYFDSLFAFPGIPRYNVLDFGDYLSWIILDSNHMDPIEGTQTEWLESTLKERSQTPILLTTYHTPAYPTVRSYSGGATIREHWVPLFERYGLDIAFENHDHTYKRTFPLKNGKVVDEDGIVFLGDGAWGVNTREFQDEPRWYLEKMISQNHAIKGVIQNNNLQIEVINVDGEIIDAYPLNETNRGKVKYADDRLVHKEVSKSDLVKIMESDSLSLVSFYESTNGDNWNTNTNWLKGPVMTWYGIVTRGNRVSRIYLTNNNLNGTLPEDFTKMTGMERLYIRGNENLGGPLPADIGKMKRLVRIRMNNNSLTGTIPETIGELKSLEQLLLSGNNLFGALTDEITQLKLLKELKLAGNNLSGKLPIGISKMDFRLRELDLSDNNFEGEIPSSLTNLRFLKTLDLSGNNFTNEIPVELQKKLGNSD